MSEILKAEIRETFGKGASRQLRRDERTPAVIYGMGKDLLHVHFDAHDLYLGIRGKLNSTVTVEVAGEEALVLVKDVQRNPLTRIIEHVDFLRVDAAQAAAVVTPAEVAAESAESSPSSASSASAESAESAE
ncbi:MAG: 50S ribosomal protein L25 [Arcanobacterium sp.]|nr:50S ribosomal protein L25 [Arcanobacterium sp.]